MIARRRRQLTIRGTAVVVAAFTSLTLYYQFTENSFCGVVPATICVGVGGLAVLASAVASKRYTVWLDASAVLFIAVACLSKQVMVPLIALYPLLVLQKRGIGASCLAGVRVVLGLICTLALVSIFNDPIAMYQHMIWIPAHQPWQSHLCFLPGSTQCPVVFSAHEKLLTIATLLITMLRNFDYVILWVVVCAVMTWQKGASDCESLARPFILASVLLVPTALLNVAKAGGTEVNFLICTYFLYMAACALILDLEIADLTEMRERRFYALVLSLLALPLICNAARYIRHPGLTFASNSDPGEVSFEISKNTNTIYFPWYPLSTYLATNRVYHFPQAISDRLAAGIQVKREYVQAGLPTSPGYIAYFSDFEFKGDSVTRECEAPVANIGIPGWTVMDCTNTHDTGANRQPHP